MDRWREWYGGGQSAGEVDVGSKDGIDDLATQMISIQPE